MNGAQERLAAIRQYQGDGKRAPHKPLLVLLALGQLSRTGTSALPWSVVQERLAALLSEFGPSSTKGAAAAAYPFTRLRTDGVWQLSREVPNDNVGPLNESPIEGQFAPEIEAELRASPGTVNAIARMLVENQFPWSIAPDVLVGVGLDPDIVLGNAPAAMSTTDARKRDANWRRAILAAWDRSCAFCGFDGSLGGAPVGIEAAHVRWFNFGGPDEPDNGLALCSLHHKLFDRGAVGLGDPETVVVSTEFAAVGSMGRAVYDLHGRPLRPRPGTFLPSVDHIAWHRREVFKGVPLSV